MHQQKLDHLISENNAGSKCVYYFAITNISDEEVKGEMYIDFEESTFEIQNISSDVTNQISACIQRIFQSLVNNYPQSRRLPDGMIIIEKD